MAAIQVTAASPAVKTEEHASLRLPLLGAAIGLARAVVQGGVKPSAQTHAALLSAFYLAIPGTALSNSYLLQNIRRLQTEKKKLLAGFTGQDTFAVFEDFDWGDTAHLDPEMAALHDALLNATLTLEPLLRGRENTPDFETAMPHIYTALFIFGEDTSAEELKAAMKEITKLQAELLEYF